VDTKGDIMARQRLMYGKDDLYVTDRSSPNATRVTDVQKWRTNQDDIRHLPGALPMQKIAIQDGAISPSAAFVIVDTEGGAPADDLTAINPGDLHDGMEIELISADSSRVVTIKNSTAFSGIRTIRGEDLVLGMSYSLRLKLVSTESITYWQELPAAVKISDSVNLNSSTTAASSKAIKAVYDDIPAMAAHAAMPSDRYISINLQLNTILEYTAVADGFIFIRLISTTNGRVYCERKTDTNIFAQNIPITNSLENTGVTGNLVFQVKSGEKISYAAYGTAASVDNAIIARFYYAEGAGS
jgi:hypothetical protein